MDYKLTVDENGNVEVLIKSGSDLTRTYYPEAKCKAILAASKKVEPSEYDGYITVKDMLIAGKIVAEKKPTAKKK